MEYDSYSQFLARLDTDAEHILSGSVSPDRLSALSPAATSATSSSLSPPDSTKFPYDEFADYSFIDPADSFLEQSPWEQMMPGETNGGRNGLDSIKAENSPGAFGAQNDNYSFDMDMFLNREGSIPNPYATPQNWKAQQIQQLQQQQASRDSSGWQQQISPQNIQTSNPNSTDSSLAFQQQSPVSTRHESSSPAASPIAEEEAPRSKKRKQSTSEEEDMAAAPPGKKQPKKTAHNMIEKRYRTNLNDKIAALRDSVPSLRVMAGTSKVGDDDDEDLGGLTPAHKLNKATVLAKATEYIRHLEKRNKKLQDENDNLKGRLGTFEKLATMGSMPLMSGQQHPGARMQQHMGGDSLMSRLMVGGLAGLMVANGLNENDPSRGLGFIPGTLEFFGSQISVDHAFMALVKVFLFVFAVAFVISPRYFDSKPKGKKVDFVDADPSLEAAPSLASPLEVRRKAWLTAIQTVWVPRHNFSLEIAALALKMAKVAGRKLVGEQNFATLTGVTIEQEQARVKAWTIALDAQLAGGDATITRSRLILTLLASLTIPATPARMMLNALHIRVMFWDMSAQFDSIADRLCDYYWNEARNSQESCDAADSLPEHLQKLLEQDPKTVFCDRIVQRAYNLAYNCPTDEGIDQYDEGMDSVVEDFAIRSPLDALAAWFSGMNLHDVLLNSLNSSTSTNPSVDSANRVTEELAISLAVAPPSSSAQLRALSARAVINYSADGKDLHEALRIFEEDFKADESQGKLELVERVLTPHNSAVTATTDIRFALRTAMALTLVKQDTPETRAAASRLFNELEWSLDADAFSNNNSSRQRRFMNGLGLLGFVSSWKVVNVFAADESLSRDTKETMEKGAGVLRQWCGMDVFAGNAGVSKKTRKRLADGCLAIAMKIGGFQGEDDGYVSGGDVKAEKVAIATS